jgi:hypothetical protein
LLSNVGMRTLLAAFPVSGIVVADNAAVITMPPDVVRDMRSGRPELPAYGITGPLQVPVSEPMSALLLAAAFAWLIGGLGLA